MTYHSMGGEVTARVRGFGDRGLAHSGPPPITWTCVLGAHMRCRPRGGDTDPASASSGPGSVLGDIKEGGFIVMHSKWRIVTIHNVYTETVYQ